MNKLATLMLAAWAIFAGLAVQTVLAQHTGSWGDQGNGTYKNPILDSNYPDNDVIRVGDTFYMMSSTNHFVPGMVILKSKDLVNWAFSNYIMPAPITFDKRFDMGPDFRTSKGTWAGSFGYNGEYYFAYWCHNRGGSAPEKRYTIVHSQAKSMSGPWSEPKEITWAERQAHQQHRSGRDVGFGDQAGVVGLRGRGDL